MFYTYTYFINEVPEYVGKGKDGRFVDHLKRGDGYWQRHLRSSIKNQRDVRIELVPHLSEDLAFAKEVELIKKYGRRGLSTGSLYNLTDGGEGWAGHKLPEEARKRAVKTRLERGNYTTTEATKQKIKQAQIGKKHSPEVNASKGRPGCKMSEEAKAKIKASWVLRKQKWPSGFPPGVKC